MAIIELYEDNAGGLYIVDADFNIIPNLEFSNTTFAEDAALVDEWKEPDRYVDIDTDLMENIADYNTETGKVIMRRLPGVAGRKYLGLAADSEADTVEEIAAEIGAIVEEIA